MTLGMGMGRRGTGVADWLELDDVLLFSLGGVERCQEWGKSAARARARGGGKI